MQPFMAIAHRGDSAHAPENTLAAFEAALRLGVSDVETDVRRTSDGALVLLHDAALDRTTDGTGLLAQTALEAVRALDAGAWFAPRFAGARIPLLEEALGLCRGRARLHLEIKDRSPAAVDALLALLSARGYPEPAVTGAPLPSIVLTCSDRAVLARAKANDARWCAAWLLPAADAGTPFSARIAEAVADGMAVVCPHALDVTREKVEGCHAAGMILRCWGAGRDEARMRRVLEAGADGTTVDDPGALLALLGGPR